MIQLTLSSIPNLVDKEELSKLTGLAGMMRHPSVPSLGQPLIIGSPGQIMRGVMPDGSFMNTQDGHHFPFYNPYTHPFAQYPMGHLIATEFGSSTGQGMDSVSTGGFHLQS